MKKIIPIIFILLLILLSSPKERVDDVFYNEDNFNYKVFELEFKGLSLDKYRHSLSGYATIDYKILDFKFVNNYNKDLKSEIDNIKIEGGSYITTLDEYVKKSVAILAKYDIESEISKVQSGNMLISYIKIYTTDEVYLQIKKDAILASEFTV